MADRIAIDMGGFAKPAIQLVKYNKDLYPAMNYVFGNFLLASSMDIA